MRRSLGAVAALGLGLAASLALAEGMVRLAAWWIPTVQALASPSSARPRQAYSSMEALLASHSTHAVPHRNWLNYWNNSLGLNDEEFVVPKPSGRFRIMAVGDSFTFGVVPYPDSAMTVLEGRLRALCRGMDLDVLNFGVGGMGLEDYRAVVSLGFARYAPDLVVVHFYAGNDGPDLYRLVHEREQWRALLGHSRAWTFATNVVRARRDVNERVRAVGSRSDQPAFGGPAPRGGVQVDPRLPLPADDPVLTGPIFEPKTYDSILASELRRLYVPPDAAITDSAWQPVTATLDTIRESVTRGGGRFALVIYPSLLQIDDRAREQTIERLRRERSRYRPLRAEAIDPALPQKRLAGYCALRGVPCYDATPALVAARQARPDAPLYKQQDSHWTVRGNRVAGEAEAAYLAELVCPARSSSAPSPPEGERVVMPSPEPPSRARG